MAVIQDPLEGAEEGEVVFTNDNNEMDGSPVDNEESIQGDKLGNGEILYIHEISGAS